MEPWSSSFWYEKCVSKDLFFQGLNSKGEIGTTNFSFLDFIGSFGVGYFD